ncbi:MAG: hypothetical protein RLZZ165_1386 [Bacteroidota bacterium]
MGRFLRNILVFGLPFVGLLTWLMWDTPDRAYAYRMVQKDCRTGTWIHRRLFDSRVPVDVAFVGTSKTMCDVNDSLLEHRLLVERGKRLHIANFGVCRLGENTHWLIARDIFARKRPRYLVVEVSTAMATHSHFDFPDLARAADALGAPAWGNDDYLPDILMLCWNRLVYQREKLLGIKRKFPEILTDEAHSFMVVAHDGIADSTEMARIKAKRQKSLGQALPTGFHRWLYDLRVYAAKSYFRAMHAICAGNGAKIIFLYLPDYGSAARSPQETDFFQRMGPIWTPPDSVMGNPKLHFDPSHLNQKGATKLSDWLTEKLSTLE